jgi:hypothetical protein
MEEKQLQLELTDFGMQWGEAFHLIEALRKQNMVKREGKKICLM